LSVNNESENVTIPRAWKNSGTFKTYEEAVNAKISFLEVNKKMEAKIRRRHSKNTYSLKTRLLAEFVKKETKKSGKNKRRNKKNSNGGKFDPSSVI
tara:strand:- start:763 stop:1050 length:288 start_codon:yes stop_codon:yes gene_type:complete